MIDSINKKTLVVNLLAGPGCGKSTIAADLFSKLKWDGIDCELVTEYAKDLVWERRHDTFKNQIYIFGKQHHKIFRLLGQVDVIITDSPFLLSAIYDEDKRETLERLVVEEYLKCFNRNFFLMRSKKYNPNGRNQTEEGAKEVDNKILNFLHKWNIPYDSIRGAPDGVLHLYQEVKKVYDRTS